MVTKKIIVGSFVETCSLLPGVVMKIEDDGDNVEIRILDEIEYNGNGFSCCSIRNCDIRLISLEFALQLLTVGKERIGEIYSQLTSQNTGEEKLEHAVFYKNYEAIIKEEYDKIIVPK